LITLTRNHNCRLYTLVSFSVLPNQPPTWLTWNDATHEYSNYAAPLWVFRHLNDHPWTSNFDPTSIYPDLRPFDPPARLLIADTVPQSPLQSPPDSISDSYNHDHFLTEEEANADTSTDPYIGSPSSSHNSASSTAFSISLSAISSPSLPPLPDLNRYNSVRQRVLYYAAERYMAHLGLSASYQSAIRMVCRALGEDKQALSECLAPFFEYLPSGEEELDIFLDTYLLGFGTDWDYP
jgi:hypothetical protein